MEPIRYPQNQACIFRPVDRGTAIWDDILNHFGSRKDLAQVLDITLASLWSFEQKRGIPAHRAVQIEQITGGVFKAVEITRAKREPELCKAYKGE